MSTDPLNGKLWDVWQGDAIAWLDSLPAKCVDLVMCSPPYEKARTYLEAGEDLGIARSMEAWVSWLIEVAIAMRRVCRGLCVMVVEGQTAGYRYSAGPMLLMADLHRRGFHLRKPPIYRRVGIPGSGGPDWWRNDYEPIICFTSGGKLPWSDNTATGHAPKYAPGGAMSHRLADGARVNQWGPLGSRRGAGNQDVDRNTRKQGRPSHRILTVGEDLTAAILFEGGELKEQAPQKTGSPRRPDGSREGQDYTPPVLANPGNVISQTYSAQEVEQLLGEVYDLIDCKVGGGAMGSDLAHENEAPYPESLVEPFVRCFCPPDGIVCDPFAGSSTTGAVALKWGRRYLGADLRASQVELSRRRLEGLRTMFDQLPKDA